MSSRCGHVLSLESTTIADADCDSAAAAAAAVTSAVTAEVGRASAAGMVLEAP